MRAGWFQCVGLVCLCWSDVVKCSSCCCRSDVHHPPYPSLGSCSFELKVVHAVNVVVLAADGEHNRVLVSIY